jgi:hypothetical protein
MSSSWLWSKKHGICTDYNKTPNADDMNERMTTVSTTLVEVAAARLLEMKEEVSAENMFR